MLKLHIINLIALFILMFIIGGLTAKINHIYDIVSNINEQLLDLEIIE